MTRRFYVTMTWDNWPEGGSYGTVIAAETAEDAAYACKLEMARHRSDESWPAEDVLKAYGNEWEVVDCFDLDEFIEYHKKETIA